MTVTRRNWWLGVGLIVLALRLADFPRGEEGASEGAWPCHLSV